MSGEARFPYTGLVLVHGRGPWRAPVQQGRAPLDQGRHGELTTGTEDSISAAWVGCQNPSLHMLKLHLLAFKTAPGTFDVYQVAGTLPGVGVLTILRSEVGEVAAGGPAGGHAIAAGAGPPAVLDFVADMEEQEQRDSRQLRDQKRKRQQLANVRVLNQHDERQEPQAQLLALADMFQGDELHDELVEIIQEDEANEAREAAELGEAAAA
eukprot:10093862-Lingulodinium_polyedra.AAC.1